MSEESKRYLVLSFNDPDNNDIFYIFRKDVWDKYMIPALTRLEGHTDLRLCEEIYGNELGVVSDFMDKVTTKDISTEEREILIRTMGFTEDNCEIPMTDDASTLLVKYHLLDNIGGGAPGLNLVLDAISTYTPGK